MADSVKLTASGVEVASSGRRLFAAWCDLANIEAYVIDAIDSKIFYVEFTTTAGETVETRDDMLGWEELICCLHDHVKLKVGKARQAIEQLSSAGQLSVSLFAAEV